MAISVVVVFVVLEVYLVKSVHFQTKFYVTT